MAGAVWGTPMAIRVGLHHVTEYHYDREVALGPHTIRLRPCVHSRTPILAYSLKVLPEPHFENWQQDPFGNWAGR
ncbi:MAG: transglutaminase, N-terminal domain protein, partial [Akkermansiaceae bacterium]|nr:transglutaminase, N-terminal domain protein [Akkermansiaceae bacterium]